MPCKQGYRCPRRAQFLASVRIPPIPTLGKPDKVVTNASTICTWRPPRRCRLVVGGLPPLPTPDLGQGLAHHRDKGVMRVGQGAGRSCRPGGDGSGDDLQIDSAIML